MFGLRKNSSGCIYGALIDIGSGTIGVALVASNQGDKLPTVVYMNRITMRVGKHSGHNDENLRRVREMLFSASLLLSQEGFEALRAFDEKARVTELSVTVSSPWSYTVSRSVEYRDDHPFKINQSIVNDLIQSAETEIIAHIREDTQVRDEAFDVVEKATVDIAVNEYPILDPTHVEGTVLTLSHIAGLIPTKIMDSVHEIRDKVFPNTKLHAHTSMLTMYSVINDLFPRVHSFGIINVTAEATEFGIIENDTLTENSFVEQGTNTFVQGVMGKTKRPLADILTSLRTFDDKTTPEDQDLLKEIQVYQDTIVSCITHILERRAFPNRVIISAHEPYKNLFKYAIEKALREGLKKKPNVLSVDQHLIDEISHGTGEDVYLALGARFFHKLHVGEKHN